MQAGVQLSKKADSFFPEYFTWEAGSNRVNLRLDVVSEIHKAFQSQDQQVQPLFGLLIGSLGANRVVTIDGFETADAGGDGEKLKRALARWDAKVDPQRSVVGYCRSETGDTFALTDQDISLLNAHFTRLLDVVMLVKHSFGSTPTGGFFFAELGEARSRFCLGRFPLDPTRLATTNRTKKPAEPPFAIVPAAPVLVPVAAPAPAPRPVPSSPPAPAEPKNQAPEVHVITKAPAPEQDVQVESEPISSGAPPAHRPTSFLQVALSKPLILASVAFCAVALLAAGWYMRSSAPKEAVSVALTATRTAEGIDVRWDRNAPVFTQQGALLMIREGEFQKDLYLDLAQLRTGHVVYYPQTTADLHLRLDVFAASEKAASQSMVIVGRGNAAQPTIETAAVVPAQTPGPIPSQSAAQVPTASVNVPANQPLASVASGTASAPPNPVVVSQSSAVVSVPEAAPQPAKPTQQAEAKRAFLPPAVQHEAGSAVVVVNPPDLQAGTVANPDIEVIQTPAAAPPPAPQVASQPKGPAPVQARVIKRVMPVIPPDARTWKGTQEVAVLVKIDLEGKVTNAVIEDARTPAANLLTRAALDAARQWRFEPARRSGQPVASDIILRFHF